MKEISELILPGDIRYAKDHEWAKMEGDTATIGISDFAQAQLGDIVFVELPTVGQVFKLGQEFGTLESTKAVAELYMPLAGEVAAINSGLENSPGDINTDPYGSGWIVKIKPADPAEYAALMDKPAYLKFLEESE